MRKSENCTTQVLQHNIYKSNRLNRQNLKKHTWKKQTEILTTEIQRY